MSIYGLVLFSSFLKEQQDKRKKIIQLTDAEDN